MPIVLYRVDERLIHGQVVVGWGSSLHPERVFVVDDALAASEWEQELYTLGLPTGLEAVFVDISRAISRLQDWRSSEQRSILLTRDIQTMRKLAEAGVLGDAEINIGGIHYAPGRDKALPYVFLDRAEREELLRLARRNPVSAQDLPRSKKVGLERLLGAISE